MIDFKPSPKESARFGLRIGRATVEEADAEDIVSALEREPWDVAILRLPSRAIDVLDDLRRHGLAAIVADTLVTYEISLESRRPSECPGVTLREAAGADRPLLESMSREIFEGYVSHYHANPLFPPDRILDGYGEWAASHLDELDGAGAWIVETDGKVVGFSCYRIDTEHGIAVGVLNGIRPAARGRGNYRAMLRAMLDHFARLGLSRFSITTQAHNLAVQRTWMREGLTLHHVVTTVHINKLCANGAATNPESDQTDPPNRSTH
jgi:GNAT superfamily N-acetyltransferase